MFFVQLEYVTTYIKIPQLQLRIKNEIAKLPKSAKHLQSFILVKKVEMGDRSAMANTNGTDIFTL